MLGKKMKGEEKRDKKGKGGFNMLPYHKVQEFISKVADDWRKRGNKQFYVKKSSNKLQMKNLSSSLSNFRSLEEKKSHFPLDLWDKN